MKHRRQSSQKGMYGKVMLSMLTAIVIPIVFLFSQSGYLDGVESKNILLKNTPNPWPPMVGQRYPDLELIDPDGGRFRLSQLKGKIIIIEPTGMNCPACQAFSGAHEYGAYENNPVQDYVESFRDIFPSYADGLTLPHRDIVFVQLLLYDMKLGQPSPQDALKWAKHFNIYRVPNYYIAVSAHDLRGDASYNMIPGFQLIDRHFILRADSTGHHPKDDLYRDLIPMSAKLVSTLRIR